MCSVAVGDTLCEGGGEEAGNAVCVTERQAAAEQGCQTLLADAVSVHAVSDNEENVLQQKTACSQVALKHTYHLGFLAFWLLVFPF